MLWQESFGEELNHPQNWINIPPLLHSLCEWGRKNPWNSRMCLFCHPLGEVQILILSIVWTKTPLILLLLQGGFWGVAFWAFLCYQPFKLHCGGAAKKKYQCSWLKSGEKMGFKAVGIQFGMGIVNSMGSFLIRAAFCGFFLWKQCSISVFAFALRGDRNRSPDWQISCCAIIS